MSCHRSGWMLALSVYFFAGCQSQMVDKRAQDERAIRDAGSAILAAAKAKDVDGVLANYAEDAFWLPPNAPMVSGKTDVRAGWSRFIGSPGFNIEWQTNKLEIAGADDLAYGIYVYELVFDGPNGKPITDNGKDMVVWKKQSDGTWKIVAETFNSNLPSVAPANSPQPQRAGTKH